MTFSGFTAFPTLSEYFMPNLTQNRSFQSRVFPGVNSNIDNQTQITKKILKTQKKKHTKKTKSGARKVAQVEVPCYLTDNYHNSSDMAGI